MKIAIKATGKGKLKPSKADRKSAGSDAKNPDANSSQKKSVAQTGKKASVRVVAARQKPKPRGNSHGRRVASSAASVRKSKVATTSRNKQERTKSKVAAVKAVNSSGAARGQRISTSKTTSRIDIAKSAGRASDVEKKIINIRKEFKKTLKAEIAAAFDVCLAAMEQTVNLMESRLATVLGEMSNLVTGAKPKFNGGKLESIISEDGKETTSFSYGSDGLVTSRTCRDGKLKFEIVHGKLGNPLRGKMFGPSGDMVKEFSYGPDGQVK